MSHTLPRFCAVIALIGGMMATDVSAQLRGQPIDQARFESMGQLGSGIFVPTGDDKSVAKVSPALQLVADIGLDHHLGLEVEFLYVPIFLKSQVLPTYAYAQSSQVAAVAGLRVASGRLLDGTQPVLGYVALRTGFARLKTRAQAGAIVPAGAWIGRSIDEIQNPGVGGGTVVSSREIGFVLAPKAGIMVRASRRAAVRHRGAAAVHLRPGNDHGPGLPDGQCGVRGHAGTLTTD